VQAGKQFDDFVLGGRGVAETVFGQLPEIFHGPLAVHQAHEVVSNRGELVRAAAGGVHDYVNRLSAVAVFPYVDAAPQIGSQVRDPVPHGTVDLLRHAGETSDAFFSTPLAQPAPGLQCQPVGEFMGPDPGEAAIADRYFGDALHAGPKRLWRFLQARLDQEEIAAVRLGRDRRNALDGERPTSASCPDWPALSGATSRSSTSSMTRYSASDAISNITCPFSNGAPSCWLRSPLTTTPSIGETIRTRFRRCSVSSSSAVALSICALTIATFGLSCAAIA